MKMTELESSLTRRAVVARCGFGLLLTALVLLQPARAHALGFRIPNQDAEATARGNAFVATANNPSAIYYNPAGITQIEGLQAQFGAHVISVNSHYRSDTVPGLESDTRFAILPVPQFWAVYSPKDKPYSFGLGVYAPFGLGLQWPEDAPFRDQGIEGRLQYVTISPILAWQILPTLSVAAGPTFNYSSALLRRGLFPFPFPGGDEFRFRGNGFAVGAKVGILWQPFEKWSAGFSYFSPTDVNYHGNSTIFPFAPAHNGTTAELDFPQYFMVGLSYRPTTNWNVEVGADWTDWDRLNTVTFKGTAFGNQPLPFNWRSSYLAHLGASRYFNDGWWVAAGYFFSENSTSDASFNPLVPDQDLHVVSLGFGRRGQKWSWAISGQIIMGEPRHVANGNTADGSYQFFNQAVNFSINRQF